MGAEPYSYAVPYEPDLQGALDKLRRQVFESKEFNGAEFDPPTPEAALEVTEGGTVALDPRHQPHQRHARLLLCFAAVRSRAQTILRHTVADKEDGARML